MAEPAPRAWSGFEHEDGRHKPLENSRAGILKAQKGPRRIDLDSNMTKPVRKVRSWANTHYPLLSRDFVWTQASVREALRLGIHGVVAGRPANVRVGKTPWSLVRTAISAEGRHRIFSMAQQIAYAAQHHVDIEHEPKDVPTTAEFSRLTVVAAKAYGDHWAQHYCVKRLVTLPGWEECLSNAHDAGDVTMAIGVVRDQVKSLPGYIDYYRLG